MHSSYKKRLYTNALSISTAVLLAFLAQGQVAADTVEPASPAAPVENVLKPEEAGAQLVLLAQKQALLLLQTPLALLPNQKTRCQIVQLAQNQLSA